MPNEFTVTVNNLAEKQFYYDSNIISRSNLLKNIDPNDPRRGFIFADSLGFEYLAYIEAFLQKNYPNVYFTFNLAKASLPSVTSVNKGELSQRFRFIDENTELDFLKHSGLKSGQKDMQNFCIFGELNIIDGILKRACGFIIDFDEVYILTDHGSSRLAFIAAKNNLSELVTVEGSEAEHSGRCCRVSEQCDGRDKPDSAISVSWNGCSYWSMQNYDRFKGSKLAGVELHGGAALEEFLIPVICLSGRPLTASSKDAGDTASYRLLTKKLNRREARDGIIELESSVKILSKNTFKLEIYYKNRLIDSVPAAEAEENRILFKVLLTDTGAYRLKLFNKDKEAAIFDFEVTKKLATDRYLDLGL